MLDLKIGRVYMIISPSYKIYVGSTIQTFFNRWKHYYTLNCKKQKKLYNSLIKYSPNNHIFLELWEGDINLMLKKEVELGKLFNVLNYEYGLNLQLPKESDNYSYTSNETREKMSKIHKGKIISAETRKKISIAGKNKIISEETKEKIRFKALNMSAEWKRKNSLANKGRKKSKEQVMKKMKITLQFDLNNNFIKEWRGAILASKELNINVESITACCRKLHNTAGGFKWKYKEQTK